MTICDWPHSSELKKRTTTLNLKPGNRSLASKRQAENRSNPTPAETRIMKLLDETGERYIFEKIFFTEKRFFITDFYFPKPRKVCLEIDGPIHEYRLGYDFARDRYIMNIRDIRAIYRIKNETALSITKEELAELLSTYK